MSDIKRIGVGARMSEAVAYNGIVWLAGQVGNPGDSVADQTKTCLAEVDRILAEAGTDKTRLLKANIWLTDITTFADAHARHCDTDATAKGPRVFVWSQQDGEQVAEQRCIALIARQRAARSRRPDRSQPWYSSASFRRCTAWLKSSKSASITSIRPIASNCTNWAISPTSSSGL